MHISIIIVCVVAYIFCGFITTVVEDPNPSMSRSDRIKTFLLIILIWPYYYIRLLKELFSWMIKRWF